MRLPHHAHPRSGRGRPASAVGSVSASVVALSALGVALGVALGGCAGAPAPTPSSPAPTPSASPSPGPAPTATPTADPDDDSVDPIAGLSLEERVGQLFMVGTPVDGSDPTALQAISANHIGGVFLHSPATGGVDATAGFVATLTAASDPALPPLWVSTDQEGGEVQVLSGPGFDSIPSALDQGSLDPATLRSDAAEWGAELARAGVTLNLAPVADIVDGADAAAGNPPIGALDREYGYDEASVTAGAGAFAQGMRDAGIVPTFKHFPGLGHVTGNTDFTAGVVDDVVTADGPDVDVYRTLLGQGDAVVMMSTAVYAEIDPAVPAAFSKAAVTELLRTQLGFDGVVTTDDLSAAQQVAQWSPADRATMAIDAGVDLLLVSTDPSVFDEMYSAVLARAQSDPAFAAEVDAAARRVVTAKTPSS